MALGLGLVLKSTMGDLVIDIAMYIYALIVVDSWGTVINLHATPGYPPRRDRQNRNHASSLNISSPVISYEEAP
jgi:hypothetical protein